MLIVSLEWLPLPRAWRQRTRRGDVARHEEAGYEGLYEFLGRESLWLSLFATRRSSLNRCSVPRPRLGTSAGNEDSTEGETRPGFNSAVVL